MACIWFDGSQNNELYGVVFRDIEGAVCPYVAMIQRQSVKLIP